MGSDACSDVSRYDVFLSYNSADHVVVEDIAQKLREEGLEPFLDRWYLAPGARWQSKLEDTLSSCKAVAIFLGPGEMGSWQQRERDLALDLQGKKPNLPVIPVLLPGSEPPLGFLGQLNWVDLRTRTHDLGIEMLAKAARGEAPGPDLQERSNAIRASICPYRGLLHFREEDAPFFFGREAAIDKLTNTVQRQPFVAVVGASGSGKSSVVRAGLVPKLRRDLHTAWETVVLVPTDQPLKALARAVIPLLEPTLDEIDRLAKAAKLAEHFRSGTICLNDIVERILEKQSGTNRLLIVVDQFEELYTLTSDEGARRRFLDELLAASSRAGAKANIALTLRGDFVGKALAYRPLSDRLQDAQINLGPMTREELECAIRRPAEKIELKFEPGLVKLILNDVGDEPGNLPLLEFVLKELWEKRRNRVLMNETYDVIGGLQGAVATKADELFKRLSSAEQKTLQRVFLRIVRPSESGPDTRRRAAFVELPPEGANLVRKLAEERLLVTNQSLNGLEQTVEVAHEALISNWSPLRAWVNEDREFLLWRERLGALLTEWERAQESDEVLLGGPLLVEAQKWFDRRNQDLSDRERKFISASDAFRKWLVREKKGRQLRNAAGIILTSLAAILAYIAIADDGLAMPGGDSVRRLLDRFNVSFFRPVHNKAQIQHAAASARGLLTESLHGEDWTIRWSLPYSKGTVVPKFQTWDNSQSICAVLRDSDALSHERRSDFLIRLDASFSQEQLIESSGKRFGWYGENADCPQAEPALWTLAAVAVALGHSNLLDNDQRQHFLSRLRYTEQVADLYRPIDDGGWNMFPQQEDPADHSTYTTALALLGLLEMRQAGLDWEEDRSKLDRLLQGATHWLSVQFEDEGDLPGWRPGAGDEKGAPPVEGLTLQILSELLRAEEVSGATIAPAILKAIPLYINRLLGRHFDFPPGNTQITRKFTNFDGTNVTRSIYLRFDWLPWGIECTARWLRRLERTGGTLEDRVQAQRVLGYLVVDLGTHRPTEVDYRVSELLYALATIQILEEPSPNVDLGKS
jgi:energy-coupling factor transporter ATP-binding protein EcfA2